jgi:hypothetical protein
MDHTPPISREKLEGHAEAFAEAIKLVQYLPPEEAVVALTHRVRRATLQLAQGQSGARIEVLYERV